MPQLNDEMLYRQHKIYWPPAYISNPYAHYFSSVKNFTPFSNNLLQRTIEALRYWLRPIYDRLAVTEKLFTDTEFVLYKHLVNKMMILNEKDSVDIYSYEAMFLRTNDE